MTANQINYQKHLEDIRSHRAGEQENYRSNTAREAENLRSHLRSEQLQQDQNAETRRSNLAREAETNRSNLARELETNRSNLAKELETNRSNLAREAETHRSNLANEEIGRDRNAATREGNQLAYQGRIDAAYINQYGISKTDAGQVVDTVKQASSNLANKLVKPTAAVILAPHVAANLPRSIVHGLANSFKQLRKEKQQ